MSFPVTKSHFAVSPHAVDRTWRDPSITESPGGLFKTMFASDALLAPLGADPTLPAGLKLISSLHGRLERLLLAIPDYVFSPDSASYRQVYSRLLETLPDYTELDIAYNEGYRGEVEQLLSDASRRGQATLYSLDAAFTVWAEDAYVTAVAENGAGDTYFIEPYHFRRAADAVLADLISHASDLKNTSAPLYFQGGNVLIGDTFFLIGADYPRNTLAAALFTDIERDQPLEAQMRKVAAKYQKYLDPSREVFFPTTLSHVPDMTLAFSQDPSGTHIVELQNRGTGLWQPIFHIDMFVTLLGRGQDGKYNVMVGSPREAEKILGVSYAQRGLSRYFDQFANNLVAKGFRVVRNPLALAYRDHQDANGNVVWQLDDIRDWFEYRHDKSAADYVVQGLRSRGATSAAIRSWYFATSNNLISESADRKRAWMPQYGYGGFGYLEAVDRRNAELLGEHGFDVHGLGDFHQFAYNLGAAHCITKYLRRGA